MKNLKMENLEKNLEKSLEKNLEKILKKRNYKSILMKW